MLPPGWTLERARRAAAEAPLGAHLPRPGLYVVERPGWWQVVSPTSADSSGNEVLRSDGAYTTDEHVDQVIADYASRGSAFRWAVYPWSPAGLAARLAARGCSSWEAWAMVLDAAHPVAIPAHVSVDLLGPTGADRFADASAAGWGMTPADRDLCADHYRALLTRVPPGACCVLAHVHDAVAGSGAALLRDDGSAYLTSAVVLPDHRGRGVYRALVGARLDALRRRGVRLVTTHARAATSGPILARLGFRTLFRYQLYQWVPP